MPRPLLFAWWTSQSRTKTQRSLADRVQVSLLPINYHIISYFTFGFTCWELTKSQRRRNSKQTQARITWRKEHNRRPEIRKSLQINTIRPRVSFSEGNVFKFFKNDFEMYSNSIKPVLSDQKIDIVTDLGFLRGRQP